MTTIRAEAVIVKNGETVVVSQHTTKQFAKVWGSRKAREIGGSYEVRSVTPYEFKPE